MHDVSPVGAILLLYDQWIKDLRKAQSAMRESRPEACANELKHAHLILQQLEGSLDHSTGEAFVPWLLRFYGMMRKNMLEAQVKRSSEMLDETIEHILTVRSAWQEVERRNQTAFTSAPIPKLMGEQEHVNNDWSA